MPISLPDSNVVSNGYCRAVSIACLAAGAEKKRSWMVSEASVALPTGCLAVWLPGSLPGAQGPRGRPLAGLVAAAAPTAAKAMPDHLLRQLTSLLAGWLVG